MRQATRSPRIILSALSIALPLTLGACDSKSADSKADKGKADKGKANKGKADKGKADAKKPAKTAKKKPKRNYRPGMVPPGGMSPEEIKEFAEAVGDPTKGVFTLENAFDGAPDLADKSKGKLIASFDTTMGSFDCELYEDKAPMTVANFVGLARGKRPTYDQKTKTWVEQKYYDGVIFHRVIKGFMNQTGDRAGSGRGNPGYVITDELPEKLTKDLMHKGPGILSMAKRNPPNTGSTQFFITAADTPHLDGKHTVFGKCDPKIPLQINAVKTDPRNDRPHEKVTINTVTISRKP